MGRITKLFAKKVIMAMEGNVEHDQLLRSVGLHPEQPVDPAHMLSDADYYSLLEQVAEHDDNPTTIPLRAGASMRCDDYGALGLAMKSAVNLRGTYERAIRYALVLTSVAAYELEPAPEGAFMHLRRSGERRLGMRLSNEATLASIVTLSKEVSTQPFQPLGVFLKHSAPDSLEAHRNFFGCPVHFDTDRDAFLVSSESLNTPNHLGDQSISRFFDSHLDDEVSKLEDDLSLDQQVRQCVSRALSEGVPAISVVARQLAMSGRTLQRRLSDLGTSYQYLVDEARRHLAERLIRETDYSLAEVAFMSGFSEQSAFSRAFKRWNGQTPRSYRLQSQQTT